VRCVQASALYYLFNERASTAVDTLSLHGALPIFRGRVVRGRGTPARALRVPALRVGGGPALVDGLDLLGQQRRVGGDRESSAHRSEEHTSGLQSPEKIVCRLLLEKKKREGERH